MLYVHPNMPHQIHDLSICDRGYVTFTWFCVFILPFHLPPVSEWNLSKEHFNGKTPRLPAASFLEGETRLMWASPSTRCSRRPSNTQCSHVCVQQVAQLHVQCSHYSRCYWINDSKRILKLRIQWSKKYVRAFTIILVSDFYSTSIHTSYAVIFYSWRTLLSKKSLLAWTPHNYCQLCDF